MSEMVERVAAAICPWSARKSPECPRCRMCWANAYAGIKAMRYPSDEMIKSGEELPHSVCIADVYQVMIDEALK